MASNLFLKLVWQVERVEQGLETPAVVQVPKQWQEEFGF
jgi:hypothetical protein